MPIKEDGGSAKILCKNCGEEKLFGHDDATCICFMKAKIKELKEENEHLDNLVNTPHLHNFAEAVVLEACHQRERWGSSHDAGKEDTDWFWLIGYLSGKALNAAITGNKEKALHHTISTAAALSNWHAAINGDNNEMRAGTKQDD